MKKQILILALLLPLLASCAEKQPEPYPYTPDQDRRLVVYTSHKEEVYTPIIREFEERTGIWVDVVSGGTNELLQRIQQEADDWYTGFAATNNRTRVMPPTARCLVQRRRYLTIRS